MPKVGKLGTTPTPKIGTTGNTGGGTSTGGGKMDFLPSPQKQNTSSAGISSSSSKGGQIPFLPNKPTGRK